MHSIAQSGCKVQRLNIKVQILTIEHSAVKVFCYRHYEHFVIFSAQITVILLHKLNPHNNRKEPSFFSSPLSSITPAVLTSMTSHSPLLGCSHRCAQQVAENSWGKSKTSRQSYLMAWSARPLSQMSCNLVPSEGAGPRATGGFDRQARQPIASLLLRQRTNQRPSNFHEATGASVRSRWTSSIMCGRPNGTEFGCVSNTQKAPSACVTLLRH